MKKTIRLTESDLKRIVKRVIKEDDAEKEDSGTATGRSLACEQVNAPDDSS